MVCIYACLRMHVVNHEFDIISQYFILLKNKKPFNSDNKTLF